MRQGLQRVKLQRELSQKEVGLAYLHSFDGYDEEVFMLVFTHQNPADPKQQYFWRIEAQNLPGSAPDGQERPQKESDEYQS